MSTSLKKCATTNRFWIQVALLLRNMQKILLEQPTKSLPFSLGK
jgi:hypothetical protein